MNRLLYLFCLCGLICFFTVSCKKESLSLYSSEDNVYFNCLLGVDPANGNVGLYQDTMDITFSFSDQAVTDTFLPVPIAVTGTPKAYDRTINLTSDVSSSAVAGKHYEFPSSMVIHAGKLMDTVYVHLFRTSDLKTTDVDLLLRLDDSEELKANMKYRAYSPRSSTIDINDTVFLTTFKINITDKLSAGPYWSSYFSYPFGTFSEKKVRLMNQIVGMPLDFWSVPPESAERRANLYYYGGFTARYLSDQTLAGNTIFEADGVTPMKMGGQFP